MSNQPPDDDNNLLNFIAATVEELRGQIVDMREQMATKDDIARLEAQMATKADIARLEERIRVETTAIRGDIERVHLRLDAI